MFVHAAWLFAEFVREYSATAGSTELAGLGLNVTKVNVWWGLAAFLVAVALSVGRVRRLRRTAATGSVDL